MSSKKFKSAALTWALINAMGIIIFFAGGMQWGTVAAGWWTFFCALVSSVGAAIAGERK